MLLLFLKRTLLHKIWPPVLFYPSAYSKKTYRSSYAGVTVASRVVQAKLQELSFRRREFHPNLFCNLFASFCRIETCFPSWVGNAP